MKQRSHETMWNICMFLQFHHLNVRFFCVWCVVEIFGVASNWSYDLWSVVCSKPCLPWCWTTEATTTSTPFMQQLDFDFRTKQQKLKALNWKIWMAHGFAATWDIWSVDDDDGSHTHQNKKPKKSSSPPIVTGCTHH